MSSSQRSMFLQIGTVIFAAIAVGASLCAYQGNADAALLREQLAAATADIKQARDQVSSLTTQLSASQKQVSEDRQQLTSTQQQITAETMQLLSASRPDLPIKLSFRRAQLSQGEVAVMQNLSNQTLEITLDVQNSATGAHFQRALVINPGQVGQFGPQEGWAFVSGQLVTLSNPAFRPITQPVGG